MTKKDASKAERRREAREQRRAEQRAAQARQRRRRALMWGGAGALAVVAMVLLIALNRGGSSVGLAAPGVRVPVVPASHIPPETKATGYSSNPPTSGPHWPNPAPWGIHTEVLPDEILVHNLEHGGVWISYKDPKDTALADRLAAIVRRYPTKVILTPRPQDDSAIALAAWGILLKLKTFDEQKIVEFINAYRGRTGPEAQTAD